MSHNSRRCFESSTLNKSYFFPAAEMHHSSTATGMNVQTTRTEGLKEPINKHAIVMKDAKPKHVASAAAFRRLDGEESGDRSLSDESRRAGE